MKYPTALVILFAGLVVVAGFYHQTTGETVAAIMAFGSAFLSLGVLMLCSTVEC